MSRFTSADDAVASLLSREHGAAPELVRLVNLHGGSFKASDGPASLRTWTQRLFMPRYEDGKIIKVPNMDVLRLDSRYTDSVRAESWALLESLGCLDSFNPTSQEYTAVLAQGTLPRHAKANFDQLIAAANNGLKIGEEIFMLSTPYLIRDPTASKKELNEVNADLIPGP